MVLIAALAGAAQAQPAPQPLSLLDVPFISQSEALCGGAAAAMVLRYWGERGVDAESFAHLVDRSAAGIRTTALVGELRNRGWNATGLTGSDDGITRELAAGRPVLTLIEDRPGTYHYIVIVAATDRAVVLHDPARAPLRVMTRGEFSRRWSAADRWMAIVLPREATPEIAARAAPAVAPANACDARVADGVGQAQAGDLAAAERTLTTALSCPGAGALRELAGVRLLQRRWSEVEALASAAVDVEPRDEHAWRLLATSRFLQNDADGALHAWNRVGEPRIDLVAVSGLSRTRQRSVERLLGVRAGRMLTPAELTRARRRLDDLPSAMSTRLDYVPAPSGLAELRAAVNERPVVPIGVWSYAAIGLGAAANREVAFAIGSPTGAGELFNASWRFWRERPRVTASVESPAPWGGTWAVQASAGRDTFDRQEIPVAERRSGAIAISNWIAAGARVSLETGVTRWETGGAHATVGGTLRIVNRDDRVDAAVTTKVWGGSATFSTLESAVTARTSTVRRGRVYIARVGAGAATGALPADLWFAGDTGHARDVLLRAHPLLRDGRVTTAQLGRRIVHGSGEAQQWWGLSVARIGAAVFVDSVRISRRLDPGARSDVDAGVGARLALPGFRGIFRADVARGLRDGATSFAFVYAPRG